MKRVLVSGLVIGVLATGCGGAADDTAESATTVESHGDRDERESVPPSSMPGMSEAIDGETAPPEAQPADVPEERTADDQRLPERVPTTTESPVTGEGDPILVASIKNDLANRTGAAEANFTVVRSEEVIWNDGSLGCALPGETYTQAPVSGYWVVLEHAGTTYDYRTSGSGFFKLCEGLGSPPANPTG